MPFVVSSCAEKFNTVSNGHERTQRCDFSNLVQKIKIVNLSWNLVHSLIGIYVKFNGDNHTVLFLGRFGRKI